MGAIDMPLVGSFSPVATEIMALWADLQFITDAAILPVLTEMDCWELVVLVYLKDRCWAEWVVWWRKSTLCYKLSASPSQRTFRQCLSKGEFGGRGQFARTLKSPATGPSSGKNTGREFIHPRF
ncbi:hypothetical protein M0R45_019017 [Rubus argutus]|uniref:Uncharacterized protein n=1 Tax=Rubus argutus TaxID=59490 RepID=A0AAW1X6V4_RUBAR